MLLAALVIGCGSAKNFDSLGLGDFWKFGLLARPGITSPHFKA
jgi:hypothetical protein